jgi:hypothetical protein
MIRRGTRERVPQELAQPQRVGAAPRDAAFGVDPLEVPDEQHAEVHPGRDAGAAVVSVELRAPILREAVEPRLGQHPVELRIERMPRTLHDPVRSDPQLVLPLAVLLAKRHRTPSVTPARPCLYHQVRSLGALFQRAASPYKNAKVGAWEVLGKYNGHPAWKCRSCGAYVQVRPLGVSLIERAAGERMEAALHAHLKALGLSDEGEKQP